MDAARIRSETDRTHPVYRNEADAAKLGRQDGQTGCEASGLFVLAPPPAHETEERSESVNEAERMRAAPIV